VFQDGVGENVTDTHVSFMPSTTVGFRQRRYLLPVLVTKLNLLSTIMCWQRGFCDLSVTGVLALLVKLSNDYRQIGPVLYVNAFNYQTKCSNF